MKGAAHTFAHFAYDARNAIPVISRFSGVSDGANSATDSQGQFGMAPADCQGVETTNTTRSRSIPNAVYPPKEIGELSIRQLRH